MKLQGGGSIGEREGAIPGLSPEESRLLDRVATRCYMAYLNSGYGDAFTKEDFLHQGLIGLLEAKRRFDPERGVSFVAFAERRVFGSIQDWLRKLPTVAVPQRRWQEVRRLQQAEEEAAGADDPRGAAMEALGWDREKVEEVRRYAPQMLFLDQQEELKDGDRPPFQLEDRDGVTPEEATIGREVREAVHTCLKVSLSAEERHIILSRILHGTTLRELAERYDCSIEWVRRRQMKAQALLKKCLEEKGFSVEDGYEYNITHCL